MVEALRLNCFYELNYTDLYAVDGGDWLRTACGVIGGIIGAAGTFLGTAAAVSPVMTPFGGAIVGATTIPGGFAVGYAAGTEFYDTLTKKN